MYFHSNQVEDRIQRYGWSPIEFATETQKVKIAAVSYKRILRVTTSRSVRPTIDVLATPNSSWMADALRNEVNESDEDTAGGRLGRLGKTVKEWGTWEWGKFQPPLLLCNYLFQHKSHYQLQLQNRLGQLLRRLRPCTPEAKAAASNGRNPWLPVRIHSSLTLDEAAFDVAHPARSNFDLYEGLPNSV